MRRDVQGLRTPNEPRYPFREAIHKALLAATLVFSACVSPSGPTLEECLRGNAELGKPRAEDTWADPIDSLITEALDADRESLGCPKAPHASLSNLVKAKQEG